MFSTNYGLRLTGFKIDQRMRSIRLYQRPIRVLGLVAYGSLEPFTHYESRLTAYGLRLTGFKIDQRMRSIRFYQRPIQVFKGFMGRR